MTEEGKALADVGSLAALVGVLSGILPVIASGLTVIWMCIRILETQTVQKMLGRHRWVDDDGRKRKD